MYKKITISIPEELHLRIKEYTGTTSVSAICANALSEHINSIDKYVLDAKYRLCLLDDDEVNDLACKAGMMWARDEATYGEMASLCEWTRPWDGPMAPTELLVSLSERNPDIQELIKEFDYNRKGYENFIKKIPRVEEILEDLDSSSISSNVCVMYLCEEFVEGVRVIWDKLK